MIKLPFTDITAASEDGSRHEAVGTRLHFASWVLGQKQKALPSESFWRAYYLLNRVPESRLRAIGQILAFQRSVIHVKVIDLSASHRSLVSKCIQISRLWQQGVRCRWFGKILRNYYFTSALNLSIPISSRSSLLYLRIYASSRGHILRTHHSEGCWTGIPLPIVLIKYI